MQLSDEICEHIEGSFKKVLSFTKKEEPQLNFLYITTSYEAGRPARTYMHQLCEDMGCSPEDLPEAINDREEKQERVRDIRSGGTTR